MGINRSGYYKWRKRKEKENRYESNRRLLTELLTEVHLRHKAWGYHNLASKVRDETGLLFSDNLAHKCCKVAGIRSKAKNFHKPGCESLIFPNLIKGSWNAHRPLEIVVSDMTCIRNNGKLYEWTIMLDTFNNEIIAHSLSDRRGDVKPYFDCLDILCSKVGKKEEQRPQVVLHTDQGSIYSSKAFAKAHSDYNIIRSMSRAGTPTDNPIIESLNGWMKAELLLDFGAPKSSNLADTLERYVHYFNYERPAAALNYKTPIQFKTELGFP